jgi:hypothetical protein
MKKNPWVAAILNFALFGAGTIYVGRRLATGLLLTIGGTAAQVVEIAVSPVGSNAIPALWPFLLGGLVLVKTGVAIDGWREARGWTAGVASATHRAAT